MHPHTAHPVFGIDHVVRQALDVSIKCDADYFKGFVDNRASGISPNNVIRGGEIKRCAHGKRRRRIQPSLRQVPGGLLAEGIIPIVQPIEGCKVRGDGTIVRHSLHNTIGDAQGERCIGWNGGAVDIEHRLAESLHTSLLAGVHLRVLCAQVPGTVDRCCNEGNERVRGIQDCIRGSVQQRCHFFLVADHRFLEQRSGCLLRGPTLQESIQRYVAFSKAGRHDR